MLDVTGFNAVDAVFGILIAAVLVEAIVTVIGKAKDRYRDWQYWGSLIVGVLVAVVYEIDLFAAVGLDALIPFVGAVLTGIVISRGSNYAADVLQRIKNPAGSTG